jgi:hypothetical protein
VSYTAAKAVTVARSQIGRRETGTNDTPYNRWLGRIPGYPHAGYGYPWCQSFQSWVAFQSGGRANVDYPKTAGCEVAVAWFRRHGRLTGTPHVGDMVFYGPGGGTHVELVVAVTSSTITTVGGNTSGTLNGRYHEGNGVYQKRVARSSSRIYRYGRPVYSAAAPRPPSPPPTTTEDIVRQLPTLKRGSSGEDVGTLQHLLLARGKTLPHFGADNDFGAETETALKAATGSKTCATAQWAKLLRV